MAILSDEKLDEKRGGGSRTGASGLDREMANIPTVGPPGTMLVVGVATIGGAALGFYLQVRHACVLLFVFCTCTQQAVH